jgi:hypothetical protein
MRFEIGLSCSGGTSGGAYTAGVLDFLFQALDCWESAKAARTPGVPEHEVGIKVISSASAGAISAGVSAIALARPVTPKPFPAPAPGKQIHQCWLSLLYDTWVVWPRLVAPPGGDPDVNAMTNPPVPHRLRKLDFLTTSDLSGAKQGKHLPQSLLNSHLLNYIAARMVQPLQVLGPQRGYLAETLDLYLTTANQRGIPYSLALEGGAYSMVNHADRIHYRFSGLGNWKASSPFGEADQSAPLQKADLVGPALAVVPVDTLDTSPVDPWRRWYSFATSLLASAAFPIGLAPRMIEADRASYAERLFPFMHGSKVEVVPSFPPPTEAANYLASDGGILDNDPIQYAIAALRDGREATALTETDRAVIMIAPFPHPPPYPAAGTQKSDIFSLVSEFLSTLRHQVRFKLDSLLQAADPEDGSRFLIAPHRTPPCSTKDEPVPIAGGALGGFGGFIHRSFREHDFQLGRRNCQKFLRDVFALPASNPIFGLADPPKGDSMPIIPLVGDAAAEVPYPEWPSITEEDLDRLMKRVGRRSSALRSNLAANLTKSWFGRIALSIGLCLAQRAYLPQLRQSIAADLKSKGLLRS